jgi:hypothetical protein
VTSLHPAECRDPICPEPHVVAASASLRCSSCGDAERAIDATVFCLSCAEGVQFTLNAAATSHRYAIKSDLLGRAIREHRQAEFDPHAVISMTHLCFDDCAENIAARYDELASR